MRAPTKRAPDWIVYGGRSMAFTCKRCGVVRYLPLPQLIRDLVKIGDAFAAMHEGCPAPEKEATP